VRRVIESSLVGDHFASTVLLFRVVVGKRLIQVAAAASRTVQSCNLLSQASKIRWSPFRKRNGKVPSRIGPLLTPQYKIPHFLHT
jgi:hypothetical protein